MLIMISLVYAPSVYHCAVNNCFTVSCVVLARNGRKKSLFTHKDSCFSLINSVFGAMVELEVTWKLTLCMSHLKRKGWT